MAIEVFAPAKVNLALHVTGRRADCYHLLDSLVVFADIGDLVTVDPAEALTLRITGPEGHGLAPGADNLVLRAARAFGADRGARITLHKVLPVAAGIGGGSADAAAALRALSQLWSMPVPGAAEVLRLGADVPVCLAGRPARMRGIGETLAPAPGMPEGAALVLVNPRVAVPTPAVFAALAQRDNPPLAPFPDRFATAGALADWLAAQRNDLEPPAGAIAPAIGEALAAVAGSGSLLARMSGSGATCFGLFADPASAGAAAGAIRAARPDWWVASAPIRRGPA